MDWELIDTFRETLDVSELMHGFNMAAPFYVMVVWCCLSLKSDC